MKGTARASEGAGLRMVRELEAHLSHLHEASRLLPALTSVNGPSERSRLVDLLEKGQVASPRFEASPRKVLSATWAALERARQIARELPISDLYLPRLEEIELDLLLLEALGDPKRVRPMSQRRFGTGKIQIATATGEVTLRSVADQILVEVAGEKEEATVPASGPGSVESLMLDAAEALGLELSVRIEPRLAAGAATGDRVIYLQGKRVGRREAVRLAVHEVHGHLVAAANGRAQPLRITEYGTAMSFRDQEGIALYLEQCFNVLDSHRLRTLAARVVVADRMHGGASFGDTARLLYYDHGFDAASTIALCERAWRGGGVARDVGYLHGYLRVRHAVESGQVTIDEMRSGRVSVDALITLRRLEELGLYRRPIYRPSLAYNFFATLSGTSSSTEPPNVAASFTIPELT